MQTAAGIGTADFSGTARSPHVPMIFRAMMGKFATGVTILTYNHDGGVHGMTANAFMSLSVEPPMVAIAVRTQARFAQAVHADSRFGISVLREDQKALSGHFGGRPAFDGSKDFGVIDNVPVIANSLLQLVVRVINTHEGGDHLIYLGAVEKIVELERGRPLLFYSGEYANLNALDPSNSWDYHNEF